MDLTSFHHLLTPSGQEAIRAAASLEPRETDFLRHYDQLCRKYPPDLTRAALETAILRQEARVKFPQHADQMYFTRQALEQATNFDVAAYRAKRYQAFSKIADLGCSIGGDALALAQTAPTIGIDLDPLRLAMAQANTNTLSTVHHATFLQADLLDLLPLKPKTDLALFFDPARRDERGRVYSVEDYQPPLSIITDWLGRFPVLGVKISPGVDLSEVVDYDVEIEFISLGGELKEAMLWFGGFKGAGLTGQEASSASFSRATLLPGNTFSGLPGVHTMIKDPGGDVIHARTSQPRRYLYEPDPAILRAGLVRELMVEINGFQLDPEIAYLTSDKFCATPFARTWEVEAWIPFNLKKLRAELRLKNVGEVVVKKRGSPILPEALIQALRLKGDAFRWVFLTQMNGKPIVILAQKEITA